MKNIFLIPTESSSRLHYYDHMSNLGLSKDYLQWKQGRNIYITSNEKPNLKDWFYLDDAGLIAKYIDIEPVNEAKKIILTTDQDLIADGVQAIDDEFLEWFVKNPSCEEVAIDFSLVSGSFKYKIIIPSSEIWKDIPEFEGYYQISN
jgi:hypothetical protein